MHTEYWLSKELARQKLYDFKKVVDHSRQVKAAKQVEKNHFFRIIPFTEIENSDVNSQIRQKSHHNAGLRGN